jgi:SAM-dependent methyltransferase
VKYEYSPYPFSGHNKVIDLVAPGARVLDVGCASGFVAEFLKNKDCTVVGIEIDREAAREAEEHCETVFLADLEAFEFATLSEYPFDYILLGDVLEHLSSFPQALIERLKCCLKPSGRIIVVLPNIAAYFVRLNLLFGKFEYTETGILERGHLRFYTLKTAVEAFRESGFDIEKVDILSCLPLGPFRNSFFWGYLRDCLTRMFKTLFAGEFLFVLANSDGALKNE